MNILKSAFGRITDLVDKLDRPLTNFRKEKKVEEPANELKLPEGTNLSPFNFVWDIDGLMTTALRFLMTLKQFRPDGNRMFEIVLKKEKDYYAKLYSEVFEKVANALQYYPTERNMIEHITCYWSPDEHEYLTLYDVYMTAQDVIFEAEEERRKADPVLRAADEWIEKANAEAEAEWSNPVPDDQESEN